MFDWIFFDLDGTLTDPKVGITKSVAYALKKCLDLDVEPDSLSDFIGPPLDSSFISKYNMSKEQAKVAVETYREYYKPYGIFENYVYSGIPEMLRELKNHGKKIVMATSKPEIFAIKIAEHFDLLKYFDNITGSTLDGSLIEKADVIKCAVDRLGIKDMTKCVMIGDRMHDIIGGKKNQMATVGVLYGYGSMKEFTENGADKVVETVDELKKYLLSASKRDI